MTDAATAPLLIKRRDGDLDEALAFTGYGLMLLSFFFPFIPALVAVVIAYARRPDAPALTATHYGFLIRIFWIGLLLMVLAVALGLGAAGVAVADVFTSVVGSWDAWDVVAADEPQIAITGWTIGLAILSAITAVAAVIWHLVASVYGIIKLADGKPVGRRL